MSNTFFTADTHYHHKNILDFEDRPYESLDEMNQGLIDVWNKNVSKVDTVYHLGDFSFGNYKQWVETLDQLKGNIILIKGNHDKTRIVNRVLKEGYLHDAHMVGHRIKAGRHQLNMTHYPLEIGNRPNNISIHGHIHNIKSTMLNQVNVGIDSQLNFNREFGAPISLEEIVTYLDYINPRIQEEYLKERGNRK